MFDNIKDAIKSIILKETPLEKELRYKKKLIKKFAALINSNKRLRPEFVKSLNYFRKELNRRRRVVDSITRNIKWIDNTLPEWEKELLQMNTNIQDLEERVKLEKSSTDPESKYGPVE